MVRSLLTVCACTCGFHGAFAAESDSELLLILLMTCMESIPGLGCTITRIPDAKHMRALSCGG